MRRRCGVEPYRLVELLGESAEGEAPGLRDHVRSCPSCREELGALRGSWAELPASAASAPPEGFGRQLLGEARDAVASSGVPFVGVRGGLRRVAASVGLGAAGAGLLVLTLGVRGRLTVTDPVAAAWLTVLLAGALGVVGYGLMDEGVDAGLRGLLAASLASFVGYAGLNLLQPIPETVDFCRVSVLGAGELSTGSLCLIYLGLAALYAGAPAGLAVWRWDSRRPAWATGLSVATVVTVLAVPFHGLQLGADNLAFAVSALLGLGLGAIVGASAGSVVPRRVGGLPAR